MSRHTSLRVGGPADALAEPDSRAELQEVVALARAAELPLQFLGRGFNTLVRDGGLRGITLRLHGLRTLESRDANLLFAEAGVTHSAIARLCAETGLEGLEFAVGIPGSVGGWLRMNAGIPGREMVDIVTRVELLELASGEIREIEADALAWQYRSLELPAPSILLAAWFRVAAGEPEKVRVRQRELLDRRRSTQPIDERSCGSVFRNPPGHAAGQLIEAAGLKGSNVGGARVSEVHANFIVNGGDASASDVLELIERVRARVRADSGIELDPEVHVMGAEA